MFTRRVMSTTSRSMRWRMASNRGSLRMLAKPGSVRRTRKYRQPASYARCSQVDRQLVFLPRGMDGSHLQAGAGRLVSLGHGLRREPQGIVQQFPATARIAAFRQEYA